MTSLSVFVTGSVEAANDVVQETFVRALDAKIKRTTGTVIGFLATNTSCKKELVRDSGLNY